MIVPRKVLAELLEQYVDWFEHYQESISVNSMSAVQALLAIHPEARKVYEQLKQERERALASQTKAKKRGKRIGRPRASVDLAAIVKLKATGYSVTAIQKVTGYSRSAIWRALHRTSQDVDELLEQTIKGA